MRRLTSAVVLGLVSVSLGGCNVFSGFFGGGEPAEEEPVVVKVPAKPEESPDETFEEPMVPSALDAAAIASAELIQSTNPAERVEQFQKKQQDPYATLPVPPKPPAAPPATAPGTGNGGTTTTSNNGGGGGGNGGGSNPTGNGTATGNNGTSGESGTIQPLPELPKAETASAVAVTGVVKVGNETYAIVQAPGEPTSRYVKAGQRLSNGRILVKRIETRGSEPVVVLEENGIEVALEVGSGGTPEAPADGPADSAPAAAIALPQPVAAVTPNQSTSISVPQLPVVNVSGPGS